jgi:hypothetical protein
MRKDTLVDEIRGVRHRIPERFGHDTKALLDHHRQLEKKHQDRMLRRPGEPAAGKNGK